MSGPVQQSIVLLTSAARTETPVTDVPNATPAPEYPFLTNHQRFRGAHILLDATSITSTPSVVATIDGYDYGSDTWYNILTGVAVTTAVFNIYKVHPDLTAVANLVAKDGLPYLWRVVLTHGDTDSITYTLAVNYLD